jgi:hypothetical protein
MTADEFVEIVRKGSDKLRVDNIILHTGSQEFYGSGMLKISSDQFKLKMQLNEGERLPELHSGIFTKSDSWKMTGVIEYNLKFECDTVSPAGSGGLFGTWRTFGLHPINLIPSGWDALTSQEHNPVENPPQENQSVRFEASLFKYPFFEPFEVTSLFQAR